MAEARHLVGKIGEHFVVLAIAVALWFGLLLVDAIVRIRLDAPIVPAQLVLFLLAFAMTVRVRNASLAVLVALAWFGWGVYLYVIDRHTFESHGFGERLVRYSLAWSIEMAPVILLGAAAGLLWLRRTSHPRTPQSLDQPAS